MLTGPTEMLDHMLKNAQLWLMAADEALPIYRDGEVRVLKLADAKRAIEEVQAIVGRLLDDWRRRKCAILDPDP